MPYTSTCWQSTRTLSWDGSAGGVNSLPYRSTEGDTSVYLMKYIHGFAWLCIDVVVVRAEPQSYV